MEQQIPISPDARADDPQADDARDDGTHEVAPDLAYKRLAIVNVAFYGLPGAGDRQWVLIDAGLPGAAGQIANAASERFGPDARPAAIILTHGHFDHTSALKELSERWDAPVYAHELERPYLDGRAAYPPPDPAVGGGLMPLLSPLYPRGPVNVGGRLQPLPADGSVPFMPGWRWIHTPGHAPGHVSLWRDADRALVVGDAFITTAQESVYAVATQQPELHGPPMYFTPDWQSAKSSVERLAALEPEIALTGHGRAMRGAEMRAALHTLARDFDQVAVPAHGKYVLHPANVERGTAYVPAQKHDPTTAEKLARALGWFSIGLGLTEVLATESLSRYFGMEKSAGLVRFFGIQELTAGAGILSQSRPAPWLWARVGGDALDLAALASACNASNPHRKRAGAALAVAAAITMLDIACAQMLSHEQAASGQSNA